MSNRKKRIKRANRRTDRINLSRRQLKVVVAVAAVVIAAVVLTLTMTGAPDNDTEPADQVVAIVDGEEITKRDVVEAQVVLFWTYGRYALRDEALEHVIAERLLYREAEGDVYLPTEDDMWVELTISLGMRGITFEEFEARLELEGLALDDYLEHFRRKLAIDAFLEDTAVVPDITEEDIREFYEGYLEHHKDQYADEEPPTLEEMEPHIVVVLERQKRQEAASDLITRLRETADIRYMDVDW